MKVRLRSKATRALACAPHWDTRARCIPRNGGGRMSSNAKVVVSGRFDLALASDVTGVDLVDESGTDSSTFERVDFEGRLSTVVLGRTLLTSATLASTQTVMVDNRAVLPIGTACVADVQTGGHGRGGNKWLSPVGCLMASFSLSTTMPALQVAFSQRLSAAPNESPFRIKWPNDVYVQRPGGPALKVGGIICHSLTKEGVHNIVVGMGLNVDNDKPTTSVNNVLAELSRQQGVSIEKVTRAEILAATLNELEMFLEVLEAYGFGSIQDTYRRYWLHEGQRLCLVDGSSGERQVPLTVCGLSENGYLKGMDDEGNEFELHPDGNSLDMMQGLIRRKMPA